MFKKYTIPLLEIHVTDHCNLNCKGCSHFSNIADDYFINPHKLHYQLIEISKKFNVNKIALIGGEPLLHPDLTNCILTVRRIFKNSQINIVTNGILIPSLTDSFLQLAAKNECHFTISKYPITSDKFLNYLDIVSKYNQFISVYVRNFFRKYINIKGDSDIKETYRSCYMKQCITLKDENIYHCPFSIYVQYFNKKFNQNITVDKGINIYKADAKEIIKYIENPIETCKFCTFCQDKKALYDIELTKEAKMEDWIL